jgi:SpoVK/Ycf46/Vps4 family AAA+-type ATPase
MLSELESLLHDGGIDRLVAVIPPASEALFAACGWQVTRDVAFAEKNATRPGAQERLLRLLAARRFDASLWEATVAGTPAAQVIHRRVVEPIRHPEIAGALDVRVPAALLLFGPPGTGKTTFAQALSGCLGWPLVEWIRPVAGGTSPAQELAAFFEATSQLGNVVLFLDEVEEFAATRSEQSPATAAACTNELLKALTKFRTAGDKVLVASTNHIDRLDPAVLRPGRFDLVLPVGPPDDAARGRQIDARMTNVANDVSNIDDLVGRTRGYTSADLAHVLDAAIQLAFDDALSGGPGRLNRDHLSTAASLTSPSLTEPSLASFADQAARYGRQ